MGIARVSRPASGDGAGIPVPARVLLPQASLAWPGTEETCPKCRGLRHVHYLHAGKPGVDVVGGKRVGCPVCSGTGSVLTPLHRSTGLAG
jgi:hypothetical protein